MKHLHIITGALLCVLSPSPLCSFPFWRSRLDPLPESSAENVECFLDYMELWVPRRQMDGLLLWLSQVMRFPVSLSSLDRSNHLISRCRYALDMDSSGNFIFRVHYSACNVQTQNGFHVLEIHMVKKTSPKKGRSDRYLMRCPAVTAAMGRETVRCDPNYVQVSRQMPLENTDDQDWFLLFRGELVVSVEDASLIGVEVEMNKSHVTVKGLRDQMLSPKEFLDRQTTLLPLWIGYGVYAYSLEASCPLVTQSPGEEVIVHIPKQRMGLVKRGSYMAETLTLRNIVVGRPVEVTVTENKHFVMVNINPSILQSQDCSTPDNRPGIQVFYTIHLVLEFAEIAHPMNWTLENYYECAGEKSPGIYPALTQDSVQQEILSKKNKEVESSGNKRLNVTEEDNAVPSHGEHPLSSSLDRSRFNMTTSPVPTNDSVKTTGTVIEGSGEHLDVDMSGSGDYQAVSSDQIVAAQLVDSGTTMVTKNPNILNLLSTAPLRLPDSKISDDRLSNSTMIDKSTNTRASSKVSSMVTTTTFPNETGVKNNKNNKKTSSENEKLKWTMRQVTEHGGAGTNPAIDGQEDFTKPKTSQTIPSSEQIPQGDADLWEVLIDDNILERLGETARDGWISPKYRHNPPAREAGSKTMEETSVPSMRRQKRPMRDLQHMEEDYLLPGRHMEEGYMLPGRHMEEDYMLPGRHIDWSEINNGHEDMLYNTSEIETIGSTEQEMK